MEIEEVIKKPLEIGQRIYMVVYLGDRRYSIRPLIVEKCVERPSEYIDFDIDIYVKDLTGIDKFCLSLRYDGDQLFRELSEAKKEVERLKNLPKIY